MYKLLIVDDEYNIRNGLLIGIPWHEIDVVVTATAVDGEDAYEKTEQLLPDIVLTDISMDNMNGLELAELLKQKYPSIKVIILSGYDDFEYVSKALELKVFTYIIKPVHSNELMETFRKVILEIEEERSLKEKIRLMELEINKNNPLLVERLLHDIINGNVENPYELETRSGFLGISFKSDRYTCMLVEIQDYRDIIKNSGISILQSRLFGVRSILCDTLNEYELWPLIGGNGSFVLLAGSSGPGEAIDQSLEKLEKLVSEINSLLNITVAVSIGGTYRNVIQLSKSYREALLTAEYNAAYARASIASINDIKSSAGSNYIYPAEKESLISNILSSPGDENLNSDIGQLLDNAGHHNHSRDHMRIGIMLILSALARKAMEMGVDIYQLYTHKLIDPYSVMERYSTKDELKNWLMNIITSIRLEIRNRQATNLNSVISKANVYIKENYKNPFLSLTDVAGHVFLNASYFSRLYKNETGESFVEALTRIRIEKGKELLKDSNQKIAAISESIGYPNIRYFCAVFKKHTGLTPLEYRKLY